MPDALTDVSNIQSLEYKFRKVTSQSPKYPASRYVVNVCSAQLCKLRSNRSAFCSRAHARSAKPAGARATVVLEHSDGSEPRNCLRI